MKRFQSSLARLVRSCFRPKDQPMTSQSEMTTLQTQICSGSSDNFERDDGVYQNHGDGGACEIKPYSQDGNLVPSSGCCDDADLINGEANHLDGDDVDGQVHDSEDLLDEDLVGVDDSPVADLAKGDDPVDGEQNMLEVSFEAFSSSSVTDDVYRFFNSSMFQITDADHKCLLLHEFAGQAQLVALYLQGDNAESQVILNLASYTSRNRTGKRPVTLGIAGSSLYLSCVMADDHPQLSLESVDGTLTSIKSDLLRFLFFKDGMSSCTFESAACPTWFICTSQMDRTLVTVSSSENQTTIQNFMLFSAAL